MKKMLKAIFGAEVKAFDDDELIVEHFISTELKDRGGDIMEADGMKVKGRVVVLMAHGFSQMGTEPIAKPVKLSKETFKGRKGILAKTKFYDGSHLTPPDNTGRRLYEKAKEGYMPNWSIGYIPIKWEFERDSSGKNSEEIRRVTEWELLEYSPVGVPMNPDAQCVEKCGKCKKESWFKFLDPAVENDQYVPVDGFSLWDDPKSGPGDRDELEAKLGDACSYKDGALVDAEGKPYPNEHACRIKDPGQYDRFRRQNDKFGKGIHAIWGIKEGEPVELQAIRFSKDKFTAEEARAWCKDNEYKCKPFEPASEKSAADERVDRIEADLASAMAKISGLAGMIESLTEKKEPEPSPTPVPADNPPDPPKPKMLVIEDDEAQKKAVTQIVVETLTELFQGRTAELIRKMSGKID